MAQIYLEVKYKMVKDNETRVSKYLVNDIYTKSRVIKRLSAHRPPRRIRHTWTVVILRVKWGKGKRT